MTPSTQDPILFRRHPGAHWESGEVIGLCKDRHGWRFDIRAENGDRHDNLTDVVLDEEAAARHRESELAAITKSPIGDGTVRP